MKPEELQKLKERIGFRLRLSYFQEQLEKRRTGSDDISLYLKVDRKLYEDFVRNLKNNL